MCDNMAERADEKNKKMAGEFWVNFKMNFKWILGWILGEFSSPSFQWIFWIVIFLNFPIWGDCCILLHQMGQFHGWFWRVGKTKKIWAKMRVRKIHPEFIQNSLQNSFRNSPKIHPRIYSEIHDDNLKIHLEFTARDSSRDSLSAEDRRRRCGRCDG